MKRSSAAVVGLLAISLTACGDNRERNIDDSNPERQSSATTPEPTQVTMESYARIDPSSELSQMDGKAACFVTAVDGDGAAEQIELDPAKTYLIEGWAADRDLNTPVEADFIVKSTEGMAYAIPATMTEDKSRAAEVFKRPELKNAGYTLSFDARRIPAGTYEILIREKFEKRIVICPVSTKRIVVK